MAAAMEASSRATLAVPASATAKALVGTVVAVNRDHSCVLLVVVAYGKFHADPPVAAKNWCSRKCDPNPFPRIVAEFVQTLPSLSTLRILPTAAAQRDPGVAAAPIQGKRREDQNAAASIAN
jgi:hypothetical protein